jgi:choline dehydrogenase
LSEAFGQFDYIVVGAGSAGCVLAHRLSAGARYSVLLLEAGPADTNPWIHIPLGYGKLFKDSRVNWQYKTAPESELLGREIFQPRGKVLGGSSSINGLVYVRGQREDFDAWRDAGNPGWGYADVLPYFKRSEDQSRGADDFHGVGGPLAVSDPSEPHVLCDAFIAAAAARGYPCNPDFNGMAQEGFGYFQSTSRSGVRCSAAAAYLRPARRHRSLCVVTGALATGITFSQRRATGVEWRQRGIARRATAIREVLVCAGAINSVQLLELSGLGSGELLQDRGIEVRHDLPGIGEGLQDHLQVRTVVRCTQAVTLNDDMRSVWRQAAIGVRYLLRRKGPLTVSAGYAGGFFRTSATLTRPDAQVHFITFSTDTMGEDLHPFSGFTASVCQLQPESRGSVHIAGPDPGAAPVIRCRYLSTEHDRRVTVDALQALRRILRALPLRRYYAEEVEPGKSRHSDDEVLAFCRERGSSLYHPAGTARMGRESTAVVDARLRVHGTLGLRVVDASVMPTLVSGNSNAAVIMIAEKAADMILEDNR